MFFDSKFDRILKQLHSPEIDAREEAVDELSLLARHGLSQADGIKALREAVKPFLPRMCEFQNTACDLIHAVGEHPRAAYAAVVSEIYGRLQDKPRAFALGLLAGIQERAGAEAFISIVREYGWPNATMPAIIKGFEHKPRHSEVLFPDLITATAGRSGELDALGLALTYCNAGALTRDRLGRSTQQIMGAFHRTFAQCLPSQRHEGIAWRYDDDYSELRANLGIILDLMGFLARAVVSEPIRSALVLTDPRPKTFAVLSLVRLGEPVDPALLLDVASSREMRWIVFRGLKALDRLDLFPSVYANQASLAESDMVQWLCFPTELGREPDEIELMKTVEVSAGPGCGMLDFFVFRFRTHEPHWAAKDGWMAGVSGPFPREAGLRELGGGGTFSRLEAWDSRTPEEHLGDITEQLQTWRAYHRRRNASEE